MKVPLICTAENDHLWIVRNSRVERVTLPLKPYLVVSSNDSNSNIRHRIGGLDVLDSEIRVSRTEYDTVDEFNSANEPGQLYKPKYIESIYTDVETFFLGYPNTDEVRVLAIDIEVLSDGSGVFPRKETNPIVAIGMAMVGEDGEPAHEPIILAIGKEELESDTQDKRILIEMIDMIQHADPDMIATYNGTRFDIPYILGRMEVHGLCPTGLSRVPVLSDVVDCKGGEMMEVQPSTAEKTKRGMEVKIPLRIHWDLYDDVIADQTISGIANKRLKTVAKHFGWSDVIDLGSEALSNTSVLVGTDEMSEYLSSDVRLTCKLSAVYLGVHVALAELMGFPLEAIVDKYPSLIPKVFHIRHMQDHYVGIDGNSSRYKKLVTLARKRAKELNKKKSKAYEGARVAIYRHKDGEVQEVPEGEPLMQYFPKIYKIDFSGQYPSAQVTFNLGPDTCRIDKILPYEDEYAFQMRRDTLYLKMPDANLNRTLVIAVDMSKDSFVRSEYLKFRTERAKIKRKLKVDPDNKQLFSESTGLKVVMNTGYGYEGQASATWGDYPVAIATVGLCRWMIMKVEDWVHDILIETDTDGLYLCGDPKVDNLNRRLAKVIQDTFGLKSYMEMEQEEFADGYFYRMKNYILRKLDGDVVRKGAAFHSSKHCRVYELSMERFIKAVMDQETDLWPILREMQDMSRYKLSDFILRTSFSMDEKGYANPGTLQPTLARNAREKLGMDIGEGDSVDYIVTKGKNYALASAVTDPSMVDFNYYRAEVEKAARILGLDQVRQLELF